MELVQAVPPLSVEEALPELPLVRPLLFPSAPGAGPLERARTVPPLFVAEKLAGSAAGFPHSVAGEARIEVK